MGEPIPRGAINPPTLGAEIDWDKLDKTKFMTTGVGVFTGVTAVLYPFSVIKTRLQIASADYPPSASAPSPATLLSSTSKAGTDAASRSQGVASAAGAAARGPTVGSGGARVGMVGTARLIARTEGFTGFYRGFSTTVVGMLPGRILYSTALELTKSMAVSGIAACGGPHALGMSDAMAAGLASGLGGASASLATQAVAVPVDVISSRLMAQAAQTPLPGQVRYAGGIDALRQIVRNDGVRGLYRGFGMSVATYLPSSFTWWTTYGASQRLFWNWYDSKPGALQLPLQHQAQLEGPRRAVWRGVAAQQGGVESGGRREAEGRPKQAQEGRQAGRQMQGGAGGTMPGLPSAPASASALPQQTAPSSAPVPSLWLVAVVQAVGGTVAGVTAALVTTPLDTIKTRIQVDRKAGQAARVGEVLRRTLAEDGVRALYRGLVPRSISMALWGTCMVSAYEFLKRYCVKDGPPLVP